MPKLSFILPAFKGKYLRQSISSIIGQTFEDIEIIIVNDCSSDNLKAIVEEFGDARIRYYENEVNVGGADLIKNWNRCITYATGEWGVLAADDDYYEPEFAARLLENLSQHPSAKIAHCRYKVVNEHGEPTEISEPCLPFEQPEEFIFQNIIKRRRQVAPDFMFELAALREMGGFVNFSMAWGSDDATWCKLALLGGVCYVETILFSWRFSGINISSLQNTALKKARTRIQFLEFFNREIIPFLRTDNIISAYYTKVTKHNLVSSIQGEVGNTISSSKSFKVWFAVLRDNELLTMLGLKNLVKITFVTIYLKMFK